MSTYFVRFCKLAILTVAAIATSSSIANAATPNRATFGQPWKSADCKTFKLSALVSALSDCGYVTVPERHRQPNGRTIELAVVRTRSIGTNPVPDPLFMEQGGPGDSTVGIFPTRGFQALPVMPKILKQRDMVFVEQRGTQYSRPFMGCPEEDAHNIAVAKGEQKIEDTTWVTACRDRLLAKGANFSAFNTVENAADIYFVAEVLGYNQFNYYGVSYGTLLGQYVIAQAKEHKAQLRSAIVDGVVRSDIDFNLATTYTMSYALRNLFTACAKDPQCNKNYPNLETVFVSLLDRLNQKPVPATLTVPNTNDKIKINLTSKDLTYAVLPYLYSTEASPGLPRDLYKAAKQNDFSWAEKNLSGNLASSNATGMYFGVLCSRRTSVTVNPASIFPEPYKQLIATGIQESERVNRACDILKVETEKPFAYANTEIPTLVLNGAYDPVTPQPYGEAVASNLKTAYVYTFPGVGHGSLEAPSEMSAAACSEAIALSFLSNPRQKPDSRCLEKVKPIFVYK